MLGTAGDCWALLGTAGDCCGQVENCWGTAGDRYPVSLDFHGEIKLCSGTV